MEDSMELRRMRPGDLCLVTGVSGYLASWLAKDLLDRGLRVRGTVRSLGDTERLRQLSALLPGAEFVAADLRSPDGWPAAVAGAVWVFHVASPQAVPTETDRTGGAVAGTRYLMEAALAEPSVRKVVVTSSVAAIAYGHPPGKQTFTEDDWTMLDGRGVGDYFRSKTLAERLAWDLAGARLTNPRGVALSTVNPTLILGPSLVPWARFSLDTISRVARGRMPFIPDMTTYAIDVRDCASLHIAVMDAASSDGERHLAYAAKGQMLDLPRLIRAHYGDRGFAPRAWAIPRWVLWPLTFVSKEVAGIYGHVDRNVELRTHRPAIYRYRHTQLDAMVRDTMDFMIERGWLTVGSQRGAHRPVSAL